MLNNHEDPSKELSKESFKNSDISFSNNKEDLKHAHFHIICVPTDVDDHKVPNLSPLISASKNIGEVIKKGDFVVYESTVYPGCTEDDCIPVIEKHSGLTRKIDFSFGYSPERIVPGDKVNTLSQIKKIISACGEESLKIVSQVYSKIIEAGIYETSSIKIAEAAKVIENTQRDINISLMNELAIIFDKMGLDTNEVIDAAASKWNFHKYRPGLVGGHCIGVDPYYLIHKAKQLGHEPQVIAAGRKVNDFIPHFIGKKVVTTLLKNGKNPSNCKVLVMGVTYKEGTSDIRNSKVPQLIKELKEYSIEVDVADPRANEKDLLADFNITLSKELSNDYNAIVIATAHEEYKNLNFDFFKTHSCDQIFVFDVKGILKEKTFEHYWKL